MASYIERRLATLLGGAAAKHWAETRFYQYCRAKRSGADINEKTFPKRF
jgi:hypothetical protein